MNSTTKIIIGVIFLFLVMVGLLYYQTVKIAEFEHQTEVNKQEIKVLRVQEAHLIKSIEQKDSTIEILLATRDTVEKINIVRKETFYKPKYEEINSGHASDVVRHYDGFYAE